ncbi:MAG TPA: cation transporter [Alphaproteobacteria bacterium]
MSAHCCSVASAPQNDKPYRRVLWIALAINAVMFLVEAGAGVAAGSVSLQADALDFFGDAATYGVSLFVLGMTLGRRALAALLKGVSMGLFGLWVIGSTAYNLFWLDVPSAYAMGSVGLLAFFANVAVAVMLFRHRGGDSNRRSVWLCSQNDAIGNVAVVLAASGVFATGTAWPDLAVATVMASLALIGSAQVTRQALAERRLATLHTHSHAAAE